MTSVMSSSKPSFYLDLGWKVVESEGSCRAGCCASVDPKQFSTFNQIANALMDKIVQEFHNIIHSTTDQKIHIQNINKEVKENGVVGEFSNINEIDHTKHYFCWSVKKVRLIESKYIDPSVDEKLSKMDSTSLLGVKVMVSQILIRLTKEYATELAILKADGMKDVFEEGNPLNFNNKLGNHPFIKSLAVKFHQIATTPLKKK